MEGEGGEGGNLDKRGRGLGKQGKVGSPKRMGGEEVEGEKVEGKERKSGRGEVKVGGGEVGEEVLDWGQRWKVRKENRREGVK